MIPKRWKKTELREHIKFIKGKKPKTISEQYFYDSILYLTIDVLNGNSLIYANKEKIVEASKVDVLMVMDGASSGTIYYGLDGIVGSTLSKISLCSKQINNDVLYYFLKINERDIKMHLTGSAIPHTDKEYINRLIISIPSDDEVLSEVSNVLENIRSKIVINRNEINKLTKLKDTLLPKLMSGQIDVSKLYLEV
nr:restriction endonuclease subunit S [Clostridium algidicarnis]